jgi:hypothetical protein
VGQCDLVSSMYILFLEYSSVDIVVFVGRFGPLDYVYPGPI